MTEERNTGLVPSVTEEVEATGGYPEATEGWDNGLIPFVTKHVDAISCPETTEELTAGLTTFVPEGEDTTGWSQQRFKNNRRGTKSSFFFFF